MPITANLGLYQSINDWYGVNGFTGESAKECARRARDWQRELLRQRAAYELMNISLQTAATTIQSYQAQWPNSTAGSTIYGQTLGSNWTVQATWQTLPPTEEQQRRWRREKLEILRASKRARKTLMKFLDPVQLASYAATGRFQVVASNGWVFELRKNGNPLLLGADGHADASFCIHPRQRFPEEDKILSLMLLLMSDVEDFLRIANRTTIRQTVLAPVPPSPSVATMQAARQEERWRQEHVRESRALLRAEGLSEAEVNALRDPPNHQSGLVIAA